MKYEINDVLTHKNSVTDWVVTSKDYEYNNNNFRFRYLREYIEAGHNIKKSALSPKIINAMNTLDELLNKEKFQNPVQNINVKDWSTDLVP